MSLLNLEPSKHVCKTLNKSDLERGSQKEWCGVGRIRALGKYYHSFLETKLRVFANFIKR